ncbi:ABC-type transport system involved in cytochrome c biogenesis, permease component [Fibrobacter sp. UWB15]|nr:ABC-type transport system involved in cytochrome c biogenesis permease subunit [Fibrobacter sp. UWB6]SHG54787.1 ABC-type transport system involved in cytochrome c biogenesis, permease component [Fibrobacter sp. UWB8]SMG41385.1 ABC-type transport system involved in cytochrome c biogenesis, permease component [Fibrobacter sp. UWB15]
MHVALLVLLAGGVAGNEIKREYNGFEVITLNSVERPDSSATAQKVKFYAAGDSLGAEPVNLDESVLLTGWPYYVHFRGDLPMSKDKVISMYKVYYDPFHFVPYAFMVLFLLGAVFHYVVKVRGARKGTVPVLALAAGLVAMAPANSQASAQPTTIWEGLKADSPVLVDSAIRPFDSFARGFLDNLSGRVTIKFRGEVPYCERLEVPKLSAGDVVRLIQNHPEGAKNLELFKVLRSDAAQALDLSEDRRYVSYAELFRSRDLLQLYASRDDNHPATLEMRRLYSNVLEYEAVAARTAFSPVGDAEAGVDPARISMEVLYHKLNLALWAFVAAFIACLLASLNLIFKSRKMDVAANVACIATAGILAVLFTLRTYVAVRVPLSSLYEIVLLVAMLLMAFEAGAFIFCKRRTFSLMVPVTFMASLMLFFAKFVLEPGDTFRPIPAVLNSSVFLTVHVFTIALGFAGMILSGVVAHVALFRASSEKNSASSPLNSLLYGTLIFGAVFTVIGTLLGGVWADFAWGRFWGFDPKECGALFVILWAMLELHLRAGKLVSPRGFALMNCFNVIVTFLCWFGVNLLGVGLHSYGFQSGSLTWLALFVGIDSMVIAYLGLRKS